MLIKNTENFSFRDYFDPDHPFFYFVGSQKQKAIVRIRRVNTLELIVDYHEELMTRDEMKGFLVIKDKQGILNVSVTLQRDQQEGKKLDFITLIPDLKNISIANRREYYRIDFKPPLSCEVQDASQNKFTAQLYDMGADGIGLTCDANLRGGDLYQITIPIKIEETTPVRLPVFVIRESEKKMSETDTVKFYGARFVVGKGSAGLVAFTEEMRSSIIRYINALLIRQKKKL
ncbi:MAG: PilZ domain-containing protein [Deltaproteobacteria bacterium]|nr:PilZ domain-containing protein [Deltaproteobacteria bacterium]